MTALLDAVAAAGARLVSASNGRIAFDGRQALSRREDILLSEPDLRSSNGHSRLIACNDGWMALSLARETDRTLIPAWTGAAFDDDPWDAATRYAKDRSVAEALNSGIALHLPIATVGESSPAPPQTLTHRLDRRGRVIDLSVLWAGPYCGGLLAEAGLEVIKIESAERPDPTPFHMPNLDKRLNGRKTRIPLEIDAAELHEQIANARVLITSARPHALARHGLDEDRLFSVNPSLLWVAITAHGWRGASAMRVGFGDDCAAAGGLVSWLDGEPRFLGDALADPLTGLTAATLALQALESGKSGLLDVALASTATLFANAVR